MRPTFAQIDLNALLHNLGVMRRANPGRRIMAVVKANAYGHGAIPCAQALSDCVDAFAVAFLEEAQALRDAGIETPILVLEGPMDSTELSSYEQLQLWPMVHTLQQLSWVTKPSSKIEHLWLGIDTGMHRLGLDVSDVDDALRQLASHEHLKVTLASHLADADFPHSALSQRQLARWNTLINRYKLDTSLHNSAAGFSLSEQSSDWLRTGYALYGGSPFAGELQTALQPVMTLTSKVIALRDIAKGEQVGYGGCWTAQRDSRIATVPIGYGDGYPRGAESTSVLIDGVIAPAVGRVSMDMITIDVTEHHGAKIGSDVVLWGSGLAVDEVANAAGTIGYELLTRMTGRVPLNFIPVDEQCVQTSKQEQNPHD
jgi:alanine racemase